MAQAETEAANLGGDGVISGFREDSATERARECGRNFLIARHVDFAVNSANFGSDLCSAIGIAIENGHFGAAPSNAISSVVWRA